MCSTCTARRDGCKRNPILVPCLGAPGWPGRRRHSRVPTMKTLYDVLGVSRNASAEAIRAAFRQAAKAHLVGLGIVALVAGVLPTTQQAFGSSHAPRIVAARANQPASQQVAAADDSGGRQDGDGGRASDGDRAAPNGRLPDDGTGQPSAGSPDPATVPAEALTPLAREWAQVQASGDPMAVWAFAVSNPDAPEAGLALSRLIPLIDAAEELSVLQDLRIAALSRLIPLTYPAEDVSVPEDRRMAAMGAIGERAQMRPIQPGELAARKWAQVQASGDPMAVWAFAVGNPVAPEAGLALSRLIPLIDAAEDVSALQDLRIAALSRLIPLTYAAEDVSVLQDRRIAAMGAIAERAQLRLVQLGELAAREWAQVQASGDPMAVWAFAVSNPDAPEAGLALSRLIPLIDAAKDLSVLQDLRIAALSRLIPLTYAAEDVSVPQDPRIAAMGAIAERAQLRLIQLGALAVGKEAVVEAVGAVAKEVGTVAKEDGAVAKEDGAVTKEDAAVAKEDKVAVSGTNDTEGATTSKDPAFYLARGERGFRRGDLDRAIADFDAAIRLDPGKAVAYSQRGNAWRSKGDQERALGEHEAAIRIDPHNPAVFRDRGILWRRHGDLDRALVDFDRAIRLGFSDSDAYNERGLVWYEKRRYERAIADFNQAIKINPKLVSAFVNRGIAWRSKGDLDRAIADFDQAIHIEPSMPAARYNRDLTWSEKRGVH